MDTRTKHTIAQDRLIVAEQRILDAERRKSTSNIQLLAFEQRQLEKRLTTIYSKLNATEINRPLKMRGRSTSEIIFRNMRRTSSWTDTYSIHRSKLSLSLHTSNQNLLSLPKIDDMHRRFSAYSDGDTSDNPFFHLDSESGDEGEYSQSILKQSSPKKTTMRRKTNSKVWNSALKPLPPIVAVIPPEEDILFLTQ